MRSVLQSIDRISARAAEDTQAHRLRSRVRHWETTRRARERGALARCTAGNADAGVEMPRAA
jgi:hypothetical protein